MQPRQNERSRPQITFTSDFHELVQGDLIPGPCVLRYDPLRILEINEAVEQSHVIRAHTRFHPGGSEWHGALTLPAGLPLAEMADPTGQGIMLTTTFDIPNGTTELEVWFSCTHPDGYTHWDSDFGKNYWLRFGLKDLNIEFAKVHHPAASRPTPVDVFEFKCSSRPSVDSMSLRWRVTSIPGFVRQTTALVNAPDGPEAKIWSTPTGGIEVPEGATIAFDIVYSVRGRSYTDDNQGRWYIAD